MTEKKHKPKGTLWGLGEGIIADGILIGYLHQNWVEIEGCDDKPFLEKLLSTIQTRVAINKKPKKRRTAKEIAIKGVLIGYLHENLVEIEGCDDKPFLEKFHEIILKAIELRGKIWDFEWKGFEKVA